MIHPVIRDISHIDGIPLSEYQPENRSHFSEWFRVTVGPKDELGEESFDIQVMSLDHLTDRLAKDKVVLGMWKVIVQSYNSEVIENTIHGYVSRCSGETWDEVSGKLRAFGIWEFE